MGKNSAIEWTNHTLNFWHGCTPVSEGCANCYMYREKKRYGLDPSSVVRSRNKTFRAARKWHKPAKIFVCSWSDFFIEDADSWREEAWEEIRNNPHLTWLILTKRPENIADRLPADWSGGWPNVWLGVTAENQARADERIPTLLQIPAAVKFVSCEPLLSPVDLSRYVLLSGASTAGPFYDWQGKRVGGPGGVGGQMMTSIPSNHIDWIVCGTESGPNRRHVYTDAIRSLRDQCVVAGIPFFLKQMEVGGKLVKMPELDGQVWAGMPEDIK